MDLRDRAVGAVGVGAGVGHELQQDKPERCSWIAFTPRE
jgi:hypothetical protein